MGRNPKSRPSFFKVLINQDFNRRLRLPPAFVKKWGEILPQSVAQLRTSSGTMWDVKLEKQEDQNYYFAGGWSKFCEDLGLAIGEFVVFWYNGRAIFDVSVYGISACEREITAINNNPVEDSDPDETVVNRAPVAEDLDEKVKLEDEDWADPQDESVAGKFERYSRILDRRNSCTLGISKAFVLSAGIAGDTMIHLKDSKSRLWPVRIESFPRKDGGCRFALTAGWNDFLVGNKAATGSTVRLKCEKPGGSLVKAKVLNNVTKGGKLFKPRGPTGKPSKLCMPRDTNALQCKEECVFF